MESKYESLFADWHSEKSVDIGLVSPIDPEREGRASTQSSQTLLEKEGLIREGVPRHRFNIRKLYRKSDRIFERVSTSFSGKFAHGEPGWWKKQMLVDRGLRSMTVFVSICAAIMFIIIFSYLKDFVHRVNKNTTSVGGNAVESCNVLEGRSVVIHLFINIASTIILSCSNTYQQLVTSLEVDEVKWVLKKRGDSRVGTNSPWSINHKRKGKLRAWLCWILLIGTSLPVHFLANSVIGLSLSIQPPTNIAYSTDFIANPFNYSYQAMDNPTSSHELELQLDDSGCWTAFRAGSYALPRNFAQYDLSHFKTFENITVTYLRNCTSLVNNTSVTQALSEAKYSAGDVSQAVFTENGTCPDCVNATLPADEQLGVPLSYANGSCAMGIGVTCLLQNPLPDQCRINVRMQAAFILGGCLLVKAIYMIIVNVRARYQTKTQVLTFGDVVVASVLDPNLKVYNECLLNSGDGYRQKVNHTCHKHCKNKTTSITGDEIGHCQKSRKCKKWNVIDKAADLPHPSIAIKYKKSLLSNLGGTVVTQMLILVLTSMAMVALSIVLIVGMVGTAKGYDTDCAPNNPWRYSSVYNSNVFSTFYNCNESLAWNQEQTLGSWGGVAGSVSLGQLRVDSLGSELLAMTIANGSQVLYSLLYLLLVYNMTLISMEQEWGEWEKKRKRPRATLVQGEMFEQSYWLQLPFKVMGPLMAYSALMHWLLGQAISSTETIYSDVAHGVEHSVYKITFAVYPVFGSTILMCGMTGACWWAFTYRREGFIPQMYGSIRTCCASTTDLADFNPKGILWGDLGMGAKFRHAGFSSDEPGDIVPAELYCGKLD